MDNNSNKTKREDEIIPSGIKPASETKRGEEPLIQSGVSVPPDTPTQVVSAGIVGVVGGEIVLNNKNYKIIKPLSYSGEAEVYLLERENQKYVLKYYYPVFKPKDEILQRLKGIKHKNIIDLIDYGYYNNRFFEILEYAEGGSLMETNPDGTYRYIPIKDINKIRQIVKDVVEALNFCHSKGIIHRDIKPQNIFFANRDGTHIKIGDFGISSALDEGLSKHLTGQARTEIYAAPEMYQSIGGKIIISKEVDYYALGITLIHIFSGEEPFKDLGPYAIMKIKCDSKVDIPDDAPEELKTLIKGLITVETSKRWGYKEIQRWLNDEYVPVHYQKIETSYSDFHFGFIKGEEIIVNDPVELAKLLEKYPEQGKKHLYRGTIANWVEPVNQSLYTKIRDITEYEYPKDEDAGLIKAIYVLNPMKNYKTFVGFECRTAEEIGDAIERESSYYKLYLTRYPNADLFLYLEARDAKDVANAFRKYAQAYNPERAFNMMVLDLQGRNKFKMGNLVFFKPEDLLAADEATKDKLAKLLSNPDSKLSIWLEQFPELTNSINKWRKIGRYDAATLIYALDKDSSFLINGKKAKNIKEFQLLLAEHLLNFPKDAAPDSTFVKEADFWLMNYHNSEFKKCLINLIENNITTGIISEEMRKAYEEVCVMWAEYARQKVDRDLRKKFIELLKKINPNHKLIEFYTKEEKIIEKLVKIKLAKIKKNRLKKLKKFIKTKLANIKTELANRERNKLKELKNLRNDVIVLGLLTLFTFVLWLIWLVFNKGWTSVIIGIIGGIIGVALGSRLTRSKAANAIIGIIGGIIGFIVGYFLPIIIVGIFTLTFIVYVIDFISTKKSYNKILRSILNFRLPPDLKQKYHDMKIAIQKEIDEEKNKIEPQIINKVYKWDETKIENGLKFLKILKNQKEE